MKSDASNGSRIFILFILLHHALAQYKNASSIVISRQAENHSQLKWDVWPISDSASAVNCIFCQSTRAKDSNIDCATTKQRMCGGHLFSYARPIQLILILYRKCCWYSCSEFSFPQFRLALKLGSPSANNNNDDKNRTKSLYFGWICEESIFIELIRTRCQSDYRAPNGRRIWIIANANSNTSWKKQRFFAIGKTASGVEIIQMDCRQIFNEICYSFTERRLAGETVRSRVEWRLVFIYWEIEFSLQNSFLDYENHTKNHCN